MQLDVVHGGRSREALWQVFLDLEYDWACAIGEPIERESARFVCNRDLPTVWDANRVFLAGTRPDAVGWIDEIERQAREERVQTIVWEIERLPDAVRSAARAELLRRGVREQQNPVQRLTRHEPAMSDAMASLVVIPARAAISKYTQLCAEWVAADKHEPAMVMSMLLHLDDPKFDAMLALHEGKPVAMAGLQSRGEAGRVEDVYVSPAWRCRGVGGAIVSRVLDLAARAQLRHVFVVTSPLNTRARKLYTRLGFESLRDYTVFVAPTDS